LFPPSLCVAALAPGDVVSEIFDMDLDPRSVGRDQFQRHAAFLPDHESLVAVAGQRDLELAASRLPGPFGHEQQPPRRLARLHPSRAFPSAGMEAGSVLPAEAEVALDLAVPARETV